MKTIVVLSVVLLSGCGWFDRKIVANVTGYSKTCVEGVTYLQFPSGVTPQITLESKPVSCN
jgi:uncharacterized lipoprotein